MNKRMNQLGGRDRGGSPSGQDNLGGNEHFDFDDAQINRPFGASNFAQRDNEVLSPSAFDAHILGNQEPDQQQHMGGGTTHRQPIMHGPGAIDFLTADLGKPRSARPHHNNIGSALKAPKVAVELKGKVLVGQVNKLSNWGFSLNLRFLKLNKKGLAYFSKLPAMEEKSDNVKDVEAIGDQYKPKETIPLEAIIEVAPISESERQENKKFFKDPEIEVFKVVFQEKKTKKKVDLIQQSDEQSMAQLNLNDLEDPHDLEESKDSAAKGIKTWWFSMLSQNSNNQVTYKDWVVNISIFAKRANTSFKFCELAQKSIQEMKSSVQIGKKASPIPTQPRIEVEPQMISQDQPDSFDMSPQDPIKKQKNKDRIDKFTDNNEDLLKSPIQEEGKKLQDQMADDFDRATSDNSGKNMGEQRQLDAYKDLDVRKGLTQANSKQNNNRNQMARRDWDDTDKDVKSFFERGIKKQDEKQDKENRGWDLKFQKFTDYVINAQHDMERNFKLSERLLDHVREFRKNATDEVQKIINSLGKPMNERVSQPLRDRSDFESDYILKTIELFCDEDQDTQTSELIFFEPNQHNMIIKLTHPTDFIEKSTDEDENRSDADNDDEQDQNGSVLKGENYKRQLYKQYAREILSRDVIYDAIFISTRDASDKDRLRVPLSAMVDYKGFRAMAIGYVGLDAQELRLGYRQGNYFTGKRIDDLIQELRNIGIVLNLKENRFHQSTSQQAYKRIPVSTFVQIYANTSGQRETKSDEEQDEVLKYFFDHHFKDLDYDKEPQNYIMRTSEIFPYDIDPLDSNMDNFHRDKVLRPELVCSNEKSLRADIKKKISYAQKKTYRGGQGNQQRGANQNEKDNEDNTDAVDLNLANKFLRDMKIPQLVSLLDSLIIIPIDSATLEEAFHIQGVNMRYLGSVASLSKLKHVKDLCFTDMLARTLKRFFNTSCSKLILGNIRQLEDNKKRRNSINEQKKARGMNFKEPSNQEMHHTQLKNRQVDSEAAQKRKQYQDLSDLTHKEEEVSKAEFQLRKPIDQRVREWIHDFMNLIFGEGDETRQFWDEVLLPEASIYYNFELMELKKFERNLNALYYALVEQLNLKVTEREGFSESQQDDYSKPRTTFQTNQLTNLTSQNKAAQPKQQQTERDIDPFFKEFEKSQEPFGSLKNNIHGQKYEFELIPKTRTYKFRNLMYNSIAQKFRDYKNNGALIEAYETCKMRKHMNKCLNGEEGELTTKLDLCQLQLEDRQWESAKKMAIKAKEVLVDRQRSQHAMAIQFQTILMQAYYMSGEFQQAEKEFTEALKILDHHWGPYHPLHINIYGIMAQLLIFNQKYEDATYLYKASLRCCMRIIGPNHIQTGEVHMSYARLQLTKANRDENTSKGLQQKNDSLQHFMEAFNIFKNYFDSEKSDALQTAEAAIEIANLLEAENRMYDAFPYAQVASQTYKEIYAQDNARIIEAMWRELSIAYAIEWMKTEDLAADLFYALAKRDYIISIGDIQAFERYENMQESNSSVSKSQQSPANQQKGGLVSSKTQKDKNTTGVKEEQLLSSSPENAKTNAALTAQQAAEKTTQRMNEIKANLIATIIMEKTRSLKKKQKKKVKAFCDKVLFDEMFDETEGDFKERKENIIKNLQQFHYTNMNPLRIVSVRNLDIHDQVGQLLTMYNQAVNKIDWLVPEDSQEMEHRKFIFHQLYENMIKQVEEKANELKLAKKNQANANFSSGFDDSTKILLDTQGAGGLNIADELISDIDRQLLLNYGEDGLMSGKVNQDRAGDHPAQRETCHQFFHKLIKIFKNINFYNLLDIKHDQSGKDAEQIGNDDQ